MTKPRLRTLLLGILTAAASLLWGCTTEYRYTPPTTAAGRACVLHCQAVQAGCRNSRDQRATAAYNQCRQDAAVNQDQCQRQALFDQQQCQHDSDVDYTACLKYARTDADRAGCRQKSCPLRSCNASSCYNSADYDICDSDFRLCYQTCGGQVEEVQQ